MRNDAAAPTRDNRFGGTHPAQWRTLLQGEDCWLLPGRAFVPMAPTRYAPFRHCGASRKIPVDVNRQKYHIMQTLVVKQNESFDHFSELI